MELPTHPPADDLGFPTSRRPPPGLPVEEDAGRDDTLPHVIAWNLTRRCNLACAHCYISAGSWHAASTELPTSTCLRIVDQILDVNPSPMLILSGGEPLLRDDLETIAAHASKGGATVVVGTNGTRLTGERIDSLMEAGVTGVAVSIDSLRPTYHDRFRNAASRGPSAELPSTGGEPGPAQPGDLPSGHAAGRREPAAEEHPHDRKDGTLADTLAAVERLREHRLDFVVQTTVTPANRGELAVLAAWAAEKGAVSFNVYFLVATGRGEGVRGLSPEENDEVLRELVDLERRYRGRMMVRSKCQPQIMRHVLEAGENSPLLNYRTRCPCGVHYARITPEGKVTPCPYTPMVAGDLTVSSFREVWEEATLFRALRSGLVEGRCGRCEYREVCGGCRARAHAMGNGILGGDDSCAYEPDGTRPLVQPRRRVTYGAPARTHLPWTDGARERFERIPSFVRGVVTERVETFARERGREVVDEALLQEVRQEMPVDFSRRMPFFLRKPRRGGGVPDEAGPEVDA